MGEVETKCPICGDPVTKTIMTTRDKITSKCFNEYYIHVGSNLYKHKNPTGAWEHNLDTLSNTELLTTKTVTSGQNTESGT